MLVDLLQTTRQDREMLEQTFTLVSSLNIGLPHLELEIDRVAHHPKIQWRLQDLYEDYVNFCLAAIRYFKKKSSCKS